ncbi:hypothetical protein N657DRAFT_673764 [Parathielavia appendiculata]|uniref:Uncharacterized protein n=1 Tax=Parathielavia appendiculata TaxID=2587402 RepID=A0AAN6TUN4_9PEZI|nr:hypothetical protein N657DRAFT_673764 [Parathielavia appendiculata]
METILESSHPTTTVSGITPEAALFSVVRPTQLGTETVVSSTSIDGFHGRSASLNLPLARKASFRVREWVKRSGSSRTQTAATSGLSTSRPLKAHIKHLGGGRLEEVNVEGTAHNTNLLVPATRRESRTRASSPDSRVTQWFDFQFYAEPPETSQPKPHALLGPFPFERRPNRRQRSGSTNSDLRPAPLRVPCPEKGGSSSSVTTPSKTLARKCSKWKPLPLPPAQSVEPKRLEVETMAVTDDAETKALVKRNDEQQSKGASCSHSPGDHSPGRDELGILPVTRFGTPPLTPDSSTGGVAMRRLVGDKGKGKDTEGRPLAESRTDDGRRRERSGSKADAHAPLRYTRQERIWLHVNYRGEVPFLKAWGLDIKKAADRVEGVAILRDLMQAERERYGIAGPQVVA